MSRKKVDKSVYEGFGLRMSESVSKKGAKKRLADAVHVSMETIRVWCNGTSLPDVQQLILISIHLGKSVDWLLTGKEIAHTGEGGEIDVDYRDDFIAFLKKENARLEAELLRLTTGEFDRRKGDRAS